MLDYSEAEVSKTLAVLQLVANDREIASAIERVARMCCQALQGGHKILQAGKGGSAAEAQHLNGEFVSRFKFDRPGLAAVALTVDTWVITAIGNDFGYESVFAREVGAIGTRGDVLIALSTSGRSRSSLSALEQGRRQGDLQPEGSEARVRAFSWLGL